MEIRRRPPNPKVRVQNLEYAIPHNESSANNILEEIIWFKELEINNFKKDLPLEEIIKRIEILPPTKNFINSLRTAKLKIPIIAEIKKASPSKGLIRENFDPEEIALIYENEGASCISVLTDSKFFQGSFQILSKVRAVTQLPLLCKDFVISAYQIYKARLSGADAVLLIAAILNDYDLIYLKKIADKLNMDVLVEVHSKNEMQRVLNLKRFDLIGINNRNLKTFQTDINVTLDLMMNFITKYPQQNRLFISESGINNNSDLKLLENNGIKGVLIGEKFMREENIKESFRSLLSSV